MLFYFRVVLFSYFPCLCHIAHAQNLIFACLIFGQSCLYENFFITKISIFTVFLLRSHHRQSTKRKSSRTLERKPSKGELRSRPEWALFGRVSEGSETILFREKFSDWPEPGRIIKMKGHESSGELVKVIEYLVIYHHIL